MHGTHGVSQDFALAKFYMAARTLRLADGADAVHRRHATQTELDKYR
jgi:acyl-CoA dehydrogenase